MDNQRDMRKENMIQGGGNGYGQGTGRGYNNRQGQMPPMMNIQNNNLNEQTPFQGDCWLCGGKGHRRRECPSLNQAGGFYVGNGNNQRMNSAMGRGAPQQPYYQRYGPPQQTHNTLNQRYGQPMQAFNRFNQRYLPQGQVQNSYNQRYNPPMQAQNTFNNQYRGPPQAGPGINQQPVNQQSVPNTQPPPQLSQPQAQVPLN